MNHDNVIPLEDFEVAAIPGHGVYIVGEDSNCWCVGGVPDGQKANNRLAQAYLEAVD